MTALIRSELLRLRTTRATWGLLAAALVLTLGWEAVVLSGIGGIASPARGSAQLRDALLGSTGLGLFAVLMLGVLAATSEFHHATVTSTFLATPRRGRVLGAKAAACALVAPPVAVLLLVVAWTTGVLAGAISMTVETETLSAVARSMVVAACWALLGIGVGVAIRNQTVAVIVPLVWFLVIETLIPAYGLTWLLPWLPGGAITALAGGRYPGAQPAWVAFLIVMAYVLALLVPGTRAITRRDIT
jgi:ABC-2 type transport system permease protein